MTLLFKHEAKHAGEVVERKSATIGVSSWVANIIQKPERGISEPLFSALASPWEGSGEGNDDVICRDEDHEVDSMASTSTHKRSGLFAVAPPEWSDTSSLDTSKTSKKKRWKENLLSFWRGGTAGDINQTPNLHTSWPERKRSRILSPQALLHGCLLLLSLSLLLCMPQRGTERLYTS